MILIAHRGLFEGPDKEKENHPDQILLALNQGYDVEVDLWKIRNMWWTGHDKPTHQVTEKFIGQAGLWIHCKNLEALYELASRDIRFNYFWHQEDDFTLTSTGFIWTYPCKNLSNVSIAVLPERAAEYWNYCLEVDIFGVCTDFVKEFASKKSR